MKRIIFLLLALYFSHTLFSQDTFSIVAVDTVSGQIGSAGASCIDQSAIAGGAIIISDIIPGRGAIHTQSYWNNTNQVNARNRMLAGDSPDEIIQWLITNDVHNQAGLRQYGIVDFDEDGRARSAAFTGNNCLDWKGHRNGIVYAIQGNILLGQAILDSMETAFNSTEGPLSDKLMAALQRANIPGADSRCLNQGVSSLSAFIRMANPNDTENNFILDLNVPQTAYGVEPIDSLQVLYDQWKTIIAISEHEGDSFEWECYPNPAQNAIYYSLPQHPGKAEIYLYNNHGQVVKKFQINNAKGQLNLHNIKSGQYYIRFITNSIRSKPKKIILQN